MLSDTTKMCKCNVREHMGGPVATKLK